LNYNTRDPQPINRDPVLCKRPLSREFVVKSILKHFDEVEAQKKWGAITVAFQSGVFRMIKKEETITEGK